MSVTITTANDIGASPRAVWEVLVDSAAYPDWHSFIDRIEETPEVGAGFVVHLAGRDGLA